MPKQATSLPTATLVVDASVILSGIDCSADTRVKLQLRMPAISCTTSAVSFTAQPTLVLTCVIFAAVPANIDTATPPLMVSP